METEKVEHNELIATRRAPGDNWVLVEEFNDDTIYPTITDALEAYFQLTGKPCHFRLEPLNSKLFAIEEIEEEIYTPPPKTFNIYGE